jgi:hypothetical protein
LPTGAARVDLLIIPTGTAATAEQYWFRRGQLEKAQRPTTWAPGTVATLRLPATAPGHAIEIVGALTGTGAPLLAATTKEGASLLPKYTTALRPSAATAGESAVVYDDPLNLPIYSDGAAWKNFAGTVV